MQNRIEVPTLERAADTLAELARLRAVNAELVAALQNILDIEEGPGETDRPQMIQARAALARAEAEK